MIRLNHRKLFILLGLTLLLTANYASSIAAETTSGLDAALKKRLEGASLDSVDFQKSQSVLSFRDACLFLIYNPKEFTPIWVSDSGPGEKAASVFGMMKGCADEGLESNDYEITKISALWNSRQPESLAELDTLLTYNFLKYIHDISRGQIKIRSAKPSLAPEANDGSFNPVESFTKAVEAQDIKAYVEGLAPSHLYYTNLKTALKRYMELEKEGGWNPVPAGNKINPGDNDSRVSAIIKRLKTTGELDHKYKDSAKNHYDNTVKEAVQKFQSRHGLDADGVIGAGTIDAMNVSAAERVAQIKINMARWRWRDHDLGDKCIVVNIPAFDLTAYEKGEVILNFPVIVGRTDYQTPLFSSRISYLDFNPYWNVTPSIAAKEELQNIKKNPAYFQKKHIKVFTGRGADAYEVDPGTVDWSKLTPQGMSLYRLRQEPGAWNALGKVKFMFPNNHDVYMHDTPTKPLFSRTVRAFSHGCIRLSKPLDLAYYVLSDQKEKWPRERIDKMYSEGKRGVVNATSSIPVHITYQTSWVDKNGIIYFNKDIYNLDRDLSKALFNG